MSDAEETTPASSRWPDLVELPAPVAWLLAAVVVAAVVARFAIRSPLWLDEALSVDIARLPLSKIPAALRHDGHPPLYYVLLHFWMAALGTGDTAVRALSGVISLAAVVPAWAVGRRIGGRTMAAMMVVVYLLCPFVLRYGSETRMYSLVILLVWCGILVVERCLERPRLIDGAAVGLITGLLLWSHYWSIWLIGAFGLAIIGRWWRLRGDDPDGVVRRATLTIIGGVALGALSFAPWVPTLLYQSAHTGTPWAPPFRPSTLVVTSLVYFSGGSSSELQVAAYVLLLVAAVGVVGIRGDSQFLVVEFSPAADARRPLTLLLATTAIASAAGFVTGTAFAPRYAAVYVVFYLILIALGLSRFAPGAARIAVVAVVVAANVVGLATVMFDTRTQTGQAAHSLAAVPARSVVVVCPDQLGPSLSRAFAGRFDIKVFPPHDDPRFVEWVDYVDRVKAADPKGFVDGALQQAAGRPVAVVSSDAYKNFGDKCHAVEAALAAARGGPRLLLDTNVDVFEPMWVHLYEARH